MKSTSSSEKRDSPDDPLDQFHYLVDRPILAGKLQTLTLHPDPSRIDAGFKLVAAEITAQFQKDHLPATLTFAFQDAPDPMAMADSIGEDYIIAINIGLYKQLEAIFRQLSLANAFGRYSQTTHFDIVTLEELYNLPLMEGGRIPEKAVAIDGLLNAPGTRRPGSKLLEAYLSVPPVDTKHGFDIQTLMVPALVFTFWHELAHVLMGHIRWSKTENARYEEHSLGLEYNADEYAARRIAYDILQSALREMGSYSMGPFWFNRSGFEAVGKLEGVPGADIEFNLEGYLYRIAFALEVLIYHFHGFFSEPVTHSKKAHPHPEIRLSRICDIIKYYILTAPFDPGQQKYLAEMWETMYAYAMFTAEKALASCNSKQLPLDRESGQFMNQFHAFEIQARVKASNRHAQNADEVTSPYAYKSVLTALEPHGGQLNFPKDRAGMIEIVDDFPKIFKREFPEVTQEKGDDMSDSTSLDGVILMQEAKSRWQAGDHLEALDLLHKAGQLFGEAKDIPNLIACLQNMGIIASQVGETENAIKLLNQGLKLARHNGYDDLAQVLNKNLETIMQSAGEEYQAPKKTFLQKLFGK